MKPIKNFSEFIGEGVVRLVSPDASRAKSLFQEAKHSEAFLHSIISSVGITDVNANNIIKLVYDVIMERIRALMLRKGYVATGQGAHEAEVAYLKEINFSEHEIQFCNQLRYFRNGISYYGKRFNKEYAKKTLSFLESIHKKLE